MLSDVLQFALKPAWNWSLSQHTSFLYVKRFSKTISNNFPKADKTVTLRLFSGFSLSPFYHILPAVAYMSEH